MCGQRWGGAPRQKRVGSKVSCSGGRGGRGGGGGGRTLEWSAWEGAGAQGGAVAWGLGGRVGSGPA